MSDYLTLVEFVPGMKAKAEEVNTNFTTLKNAIATKADEEGNSKKNFAVATATDSTHAINKSQLDTLSSDFTKQINTTYSRFCIKSGNVTSGVGDLFSYSGLTVTPKVGSSYADLVVSNYKGAFTTISSLGTLNFTGKADGKYNIYLKTTVDTPILYALSNTIYKQPQRPTLVEGDVWLNTSIEPCKAIQYSSASDVEFLDVPLGTATIASSAITAVTTNPYNQNGYGINYQTQGYRFPDYSKGVSKTWATTYTAESDGWLYLLTSGVTYVSTLSIDGAVRFILRSDAYVPRMENMCPISKGSTYIGTGNTSTLIFYPAKGAN